MAGELCGDAVVEPEAGANFLGFGRRGVLPHHLRDRVADVLKEHEGEERDGDQDAGPFDDPPDDQGQHRTPGGRGTPRAW